MNEKNNNRQQKIEEFLLNPDKVIFESIGELSEAINFLKSKFDGIDIESLEQLIGTDGKTPVLGEDYLTDEEYNGLGEVLIIIGLIILGLVLCAISYMFAKII